MKILVNGIGIVDSGGIKVLEKLLNECISSNESNEYLIVLSDTELINHLIEKYKKYDIFIFKTHIFKSYLHRIYFENFIFKNLVTKHSIDLIYNFTSTIQFFLKRPQLIKVHNLLYYSTKLDNCYIKESKFFLWFKQIFLKRIVFKFMINKSRFIEIQSKHVEDHLADFIDIKNKNIFIKSDIDVHETSFSNHKTYDFSKKLKFLYIVGPHFHYTHKNLQDFTNAMIEINKLNLDFEINITLNEDQLLESKAWNNILNSKTNFLGYIKDPNKVRSLFQNNTILVSTSIIETLGLHVIEAIKNGVITVTPNEEYANDVYGTRCYSYDLFNMNSFSKTILNMLNDKEKVEETILSQQKYLKENEMKKFTNIVDVFREVLNV